MDNDYIKKTICSINVWEKGDQRAPHKPLLTLLMLGYYQTQKSRLITYLNVSTKLSDLLKEFGPYRKSYHPEYPFWYLQSDKFWQIDNIEQLELRKGKSQPLVSEFKKHNPSAGFTKDVHDTLCKNPLLLTAIAESLLEAHFPESIHEDICAAVGLDLQKSPAVRIKRDPEFRTKVLKAYEYKCAICGYNLRVGNSLVGLEAAHIKWHQAGGPCIENNGLALCSLHHKLFDRGAFTINENFQLIVSEWAHGTHGFNEWLNSFSETKVSSPRKNEHQPDQGFLNWHRTEVFHL